MVSDFFNKIASEGLVVSPAWDAFGLVVAWLLSGALVWGLIRSSKLQNRGYEEHGIEKEQVMKMEGGGVMRKFTRCVSDNLNFKPVHSVPPSSFQPPQYSKGRVLRL